MAQSIPQDGSTLDVYLWPGGYAAVYWCVEDEDSGESEASYLLCGNCANDPDFRPLVRLLESSSDYEHDMRCDHCGRYVQVCWLREEPGHPDECPEGCNLANAINEKEII